MRDILLISLVFLAAVVGFRRPVFGMLTFVFLGLFNPQSYAWSFGRTFPLSQVVAGTTILGTFLFFDRVRLPNYRETWLMFVLWGTFVISSLFALYPEDSYPRLLLVSKVFLMIVLSLVIINNKNRLQALVRVAGCSLGFYALKGGIFAIATGGAYIVFGPEGSFLEANNSIGLALVMNIPILLYLLKTETKTWFRWILRTMLLFSYPAIICTFSRGAWLGLAVVTVISLLKSRKRFVLVGAVAIGLVVIQPFLTTITPERVTQRYGQLVEYEQDESAQSRFWNWSFCARVGLARPLTGGGFDFYRLETYPRFYPEFQQRWPGRVWSCHSSWLTILGEHGIVAFVLWLSLFLAILISLRRIRFYGEGMLHDQALVDFVNMVQSSLVAYVVVGSFIDAAYFDLFYYLVALIIVQKGIVWSTMNSLGLNTANSMRQVRLKTAGVSQPILSSGQS